MSRAEEGRPAGAFAPVVPPQQAEDVPARVDALLRAAVDAHASDLHLTPVADGLELAWRRDGVLNPLARWPGTFASNLVARLKVLAGLLTYRTDLPQEGRLRLTWTSVELRLSTFPTLHGEKAVVRLFVGSGRFRQLNDLQFPPDVLAELRRLLAETSGLVLITGPAGSGKTTTAYACLRELSETHAGTRSLVSLEDPIEAELPGVAQTQVHRPAEFTYPLGLRSLLRQDPDVILVGEIRDRETAETTFQACLTGHLVLSTFHAGSAAEAVCRLTDLGIEPYLLRAGLIGLLCQRLLRRLCDCAAWVDDPLLKDEWGLTRARQPGQCSACWHTGYQGRLPLAELLLSQTPVVAQAILRREHAAELQAAALASGMVPLAARASAAVASGDTSVAEVRRVLGMRHQSPRGTSPAG
jgi:type II secretory ATPase GspE/PulE/Tfp pilus assembly ATPase PilB-like protein